MTENTIPPKTVAKPAVAKPTVAKLVSKAVTPKTSVARKPVATKTAVAKPEKKIKKEKKIESKIKVVRDSFTMPQIDYDLIAEIKQKALKAGLQVKKSELLRAGLQALSKLNATQLKQAVTNLEKIKTGRPKSS